MIEPLVTNKCDSINTTKDIYESDDNKKDKMPCKEIINNATIQMKNKKAIKDVHNSGDINNIITYTRVCIHIYYF